VALAMVFVMALVATMKLLMDWYKCSVGGTGSEVI
jgi:hypothetical protein